MNRLELDPVAGEHGDGGAVVVAGEPVGEPVGSSQAARGAFGDWKVGRVAA